MSKQKRPSRAVNTLFLIASAACFLYYIANGVLIRFGQSLLFLWPIFGCLLLGRFIVYERTIRTGKPLPFSKKARVLLRGLICFCLAAFLALEGIILSASFVTPPEGLDYIIVLGAKVNGTTPSGALRNRIQVASEYLAANPNTLCIASGGKGDDEGISEAQCILNGLTQRGIAPERVILEDASTSTLENLNFSLALIPDENPSVGIVTNNFHVYRAMKIADTFPDYRFSAVPVSTSLFSFPHYMLREFAATVVGYLRGSFR